MPIACPWNVNGVHTRYQNWVITMPTEFLVTSAINRPCWPQRYSCLCYFHSFWLSLVSFSLIRWFYIKIARVYCSRMWANKIMNSPQDTHNGRHSITFLCLRHKKILCQIILYGTYCISPSWLICWVHPLQDVVILGDFNADCSYVDAQLDALPIRTDPTYQWLIDDAADTTVISTTDCAYDR